MCIDVYYAFHHKCENPKDIRNYKDVREFAS